MARIETPEHITVESFMVKANRDWATVFLRYGEAKNMQGHVMHQGVMCIHSDYGTYGYWWSHMGKPLPEFLCGIDTGYLLSKISRTETQYDEAEKNLKRAVVEARKSGAKPAACRKAYDAITDAFDEYGGREAAFMLYQNGALNDVIHDWCELFPSDHPPAAQQFAQRVWPEIVAALKEKIAVAA